MEWFWTGRPAFLRIPSKQTRIQTDADISILGIQLGLPDSVHSRRPTAVLQRRRIGKFLVRHSPQFHRNPSRRIARRSPSVQYHRFAFLELLQCLVEPVDYAESQGDAVPLLVQEYLPESFQKVGFFRVKSWSCLCHLFLHV